MSALANDRIHARLAQLGIELPPVTIPQGAYTPFVRSGHLLFIAGQGPRLGAALQYAGKVGTELSLETAQAAARLCALNILAQTAAACAGRLDCVNRIVRLAGLVNCGPDFSQHAQVLNGASELMGQVFGEQGVHVRIASGAVSLPSNMAVEIEAVIELKPESV